MNSVETIAILNRLASLHASSLPMYLNYAHPWLRNANGAPRQTLDLIVADQQRQIDRIAEWMFEHNEEVDHGEFPMYYTGWNDLSLEFLLGKMIEQQKPLIAEIERCRDMLALAPLAQALADESLGMAKGHLDSMLELQSNRNQAEATS